MDKDWFCIIVRELREYFERLNKLEEALGCVCEDMYKLSGVIMDYLEHQSGKIWPDEVWDKLLNHKEVVPEEVWDEVEMLEVNNI